MITSLENIHVIGMDLREKLIKEVKLYKLFNILTYFNLNDIHLLGIRNG